MLYTHVVEPAFGTWAKKETGEVRHLSAFSFDKSKGGHLQKCYLTPGKLIFLGPIDVILLSKRALPLHWLGVSLAIEEDQQEKNQDGEKDAC